MDLENKLKKIRGQIFEANLPIPETELLCQALNRAKIGDGFAYRLSLGRIRNIPKKVKRRFETLIDNVYSITKFTEEPKHIEKYLKRAMEEAKTGSDTLYPISIKLAQIHSEAIGQKIPDERIGKIHQTYRQAEEIKRKEICQID